MALPEVRDVLEVAVMGVQENRHVEFSAFNCNA